MRYVAAALVSFALSGCATVSLYPSAGEAKLQLTETQSSLRKASTAFITKAADRGWVGAQSGLSIMANMLWAGQSIEEASKTSSYAETINASEGDPLVKFEQISTDIDEAISGLSDVNKEAEALIASGTESSRGDVASFEKALVYAQKSRRAFFDAVEQTGWEAGPDMYHLQNQLHAFDQEIDRSRLLVDGLVDIALNQTDPSTS